MKKTLFRLCLITIVIFGVTLFIGCDSSDITDTADTTDITAPTVGSVSPIHGATSVPITNTVSAIFSEAMDDSTITTSTFTLFDGPTSITGTVTYEAASKTAIFTPASNLSNSTTYTATLASTIADVNGNTLASAETWLFTTTDDSSDDDTDTRINWIYETGSAIYYSSPAIGDSGTIYIGTGYWLNYSGERTGRGLYAINTDGTLKWYYAINSEVFSPVVGPDETIYVQDYNNNLYAINSDGALNWKYETSVQNSNVGCSTPAIASDGTIYMAGYNQTLYAINSNGTLKWEYTPMSGGAVLRTSPAIGADGTIYLPMGYTLYAINPQGTLEWSCALNGASDTFSSPAIDSDGTIYLGGEAGIPNERGYVYAIYSDGTVKWNYEVTGARTVRSSPAIDVDGTIYISTKAGDENAELLAFNPDGTLKWSYEVTQSDNDIYVSPTIGADGTIYIGHEWATFLALNSDGTLKWEYVDTENGAFNWSSPAIASDGTIYIGNTYNGRLFAFNSASLGLIDSAWPKFHQNNKNTGRRQPIHKH